jgi:hypothetical protein
MKAFTTLALLFFLTTPLFSEDVQLRAEAVRLAEHAVAVSSVARMPAHWYLVNYTYYSPDGTSQQGHIKSIWACPTEIRNEEWFGDFHLLNIKHGDKLSISGENSYVIPEASRESSKIMPIRLIRFDEEDVITSIRDGSVLGQPARCIEFETTTGNKTNDNELCVDQVSGALVRLKDGNKTIENSEFFKIAGALLPGRVDLYRDGRLILQIQQEITIVEGPVDPKLFEFPPGAQVKTKCHEWLRPFGKNMPQPPPGRGGEAIQDVVIRAIADQSGAVIDPAVERSQNPKLNQEALKLAAQWSFSPALCDGRPTSSDVYFTLHFQGR